jgi:CheY-like chemotaxis protein
MTKPDVSHPPAKTPGKQLRIVFVEDQHEVRESWTRLIGSLADFTCIATCSSAEEALRVIPPLKPDAVLMDIFLPRMSGIECTSRLKAILPQTRIVMLTARSRSGWVSFKTHQADGSPRGVIGCAWRRRADDQRDRASRGGIIPASAESAR